MDAFYFQHFNVFGKQIKNKNKVEKAFWKLLNKNFQNILSRLKSWYALFINFMNNQKLGQKLLLQIGFNNWLNMHEMQSVCMELHNFTKLVKLSSKPNLIYTILQTDIIPWYFSQIFFLCLFFFKRKYFLMKQI